MKKTLIAGLAASTLVLTLAGVGPVLADSGKHKPTNGSIFFDRKLEMEDPAMARVSIGRAVAAALNSAPGTVLSVELDDEDRFLVYEVKIVGADKTITTKVTVDAGDGRILAKKRERAEH